MGPLWRIRTILCCKAGRRMNGPPSTGRDDASGAPEPVRVDLLSLCNLDAEQALLGALMINNRAIDTAMDILTAADFSEPLHGRIYQAILGKHVSGAVASPVTLRPQFAEDLAMRDMGGPAYLATLTANSGAILAIKDFAGQIADLAKRRALQDSLVEALGRLLDDKLFDSTEIIEGALNAALSDAQAAREEISFARLFDASLSMIEDEAAGRIPAGVKSELLPDFADIADMRPGTVTVLAGRPKMGKTACSLSIALGAARLGHGVGYFSLEMRAEELGKRAIADLLFKHGNCPSYNDVKANKFSVEDYRSIAATRAMIADWPFVIRDQRGQKIGRIAMAIRRMKRQFEARGHTLDLVVIDYLQLVKPDKMSKSRYEDVGQISRTLKEIAGELGVAILLLAQVNRECEKREDKRPMAHDLRDAGDIEQDADTICFIYRDEVYLKQAKPPSEKPGYEAWLTKMDAAKDRIEIYSAARRNGEPIKRLCWFFGANQAVRGSRYFEDRR